MKKYCIIFLLLIGCVPQKVNKSCNCSDELSAVNNRISELESKINSIPVIIEDPIEVLWDTTYLFYYFDSIFNDTKTSIYELQMESESSDNSILGYVQDENKKLKKSVSGLIVQIDSLKSEYDLIKNDSMLIRQDIHDNYIIDGTKEIDSLLKDFFIKWEN